MVVARYLTNMIAGFTRLCEQAKTLEAAASQQPASRVAIIIESGGGGNQTQEV